jgi:cyclic pyranopterin phosphate synthase
MPIGADAWDRSKVVFAHEILDTLEQQVSALLPVPEPDPTAPALTFDYADGQGRVGVIASVSRPFCRSCNRIRLTAEGRLRNCLFAKEEVDLKPWLRPAPGSSVDVARIQQLVRETIWAKDEGHEINQASFLKPERTMHRIGG